MGDYLRILARLGVITRLQYREMRMEWHDVVMARDREEERYKNLYVYPY